MLDYLKEHSDEVFATLYFLSMLAYLAGLLYLNFLGIVFPDIPGGL